MTINETIAREKEVANRHKDRILISGKGSYVSEMHKQFSQEHEQIANWLEELKQYQEIGTVEECRVAIEKQKPKQPTYDGDGHAPDGSFVFDEYLCPNCGSRYELDYDEHDWCPNCGQKIDWSETDDKLV